MFVSLLQDGQELSHTMGSQRHAMRRTVARLVCNKKIIKHR